jgi:hypothetical protein
MRMRAKKRKRSRDGKDVPGLNFLLKILKALVGLMMIQPMAAIKVVKTIPIATFK